MAKKNKTSYSSKQCQNCTYACNCNFAGKKESLEAQQINNRHIRCQADVDNYIEESLKQPLP